MQIIIYNSSSFGGCFDYGKALEKAYAQNPSVSAVKWLIPKNSKTDNNPRIEKIFICDKPTTKSKILKQLHFLFRVFVNPILLLLKLRTEHKSWVIFNDFEQISAIFWVPIFKLFLKNKHNFAVVLHDPDRDAYPPNLWFSQVSMRQIVGLMDVAIYHDFLPQKPYYQQQRHCKFIDLPHGFYPMPEPDSNLIQELVKLDIANHVMITILGNIRPEKNYHLAIESLTSLPNHILIIAGTTANARVNVQVYKDLAKRFDVENRVIWIEKFLSEAEMSAVIEIADVVLLNYAISFTSQSGILNVVAPFRKKLIVSDGPSSLASIIRRFNVGELVEPGSLQSLVEGLKKLEKEEVILRQNWEDYLSYASWENHVNTAVKCFKSIENA